MLHFKHAYIINIESNVNNLFFVSSITESTFKMSAFARFASLSRLASIGTAVAVSEKTIASALKGAFGGVVRITETGMVTLKGDSMTLASLVSRVFSRDAKTMKSLRYEMSPVAYNQLSHAVMVSQGFGKLTKESFRLLSKIRKPLTHFTKTLGKLGTRTVNAAKTFKKALVASAKASVKSKILLKTYRALSRGIRWGVGKLGSLLKVGGKYLIPMTLLAVTGGGLYAFLGNIAKKNSGCYIFSKKTSEKYLVKELSCGIGIKATYCAECQITEDTRESARYNNFRNSTRICDPDLCQLKSLQPPYCDNKVYSMSCLQLDEADVLSDIASNLYGGIGPGITNFAYNFTKTMAPFGIVAGLGYLGYVYITTPRPANPMAMIPGNPYETRRDEGPKRKKSTSGYAGPLKRTIHKINYS